MLSPELAAKKDKLIAEDHAVEIELAERTAAKAELEQGRLPANASMPAIIARLTVLEKYLGIKESG